MIQRIQTVFLALAAILNLFVYFTPIYEKAMADPQAWIGWSLAIILLAAAILSIFCIFLYQNRPNQIKWVKNTALLQIIAFGICVGVLFSMGGFGTYLWDEALGTGIVFIGFTLHILALRYIRKDEELVRSMDRIR